MEQQETQLSPAEIISQMNRNAGEEPAPTPAPVQNTPEPAKAPEPKAPPAAAAPEPKAPEPKKDEEEDYRIPDPAFVRKTDEPAESTTPEGEKPPEEPVKAAEGDPEGGNDEVVFKRLSEMTGDTIKSEEDFVGLINHYNELLDQAEKGFEPKFSDERAKWAYQLLTNNPGAELEIAERTIRALRLDVAKMDPKEALFNAYLLDPKNSDLSPAQAAEYFEAEYAEKYPDIDDNPLVKRRHEVEAREAKQAIEKLQKEFQATESKPQEVAQEVIDAIGQTVENFGGIKMAFTDNPQEDDFLTIPVKDEKELRQLQQQAAHPNEWLNEHMNQFVDKSGKFDYQAYIQDFYEMVNHKAIRQEAFDHGMKRGIMQKINQDRNQQTPQEIARLGSQAPTPVEKPKSLFDAWAAAEQARGR